MSINCDQLTIDFKVLLGENIKKNGRDYFDVAPKEQPPRKLSGKRTVAVMTLESRHCLTEGVNLSGFKTDGVQKELLWVYKKQLYTTYIKV